MKIVIYALILPLIVISGIVFANRGLNNETSKELPSKPLSADEMKAALRIWEFTPDGIMYKKWEASPEGKKVLLNAARVRKHTRDSTRMDAVVTSLSLQPGSRLGFGVMARIDGEDYILVFEPEKSQLQSLLSLKVNDKITIKSGGVSWAPKYAFAIISGDYVERNGNVLYKRVPRKGGC